jgi:hypothetical protein
LCASFDRATPPAQHRRRAGWRRAKRQLQATSRAAANTNVDVFNAPIDSATRVSYALVKPKRAHRRARCARDRHDPIAAHDGGRGAAVDVPVQQVMAVYTAITSADRDGTDTNL